MSGFFRRGFDLDENVTDFAKKCENAVKMVDAPIPYYHSNNCMII